MSQTFLIAIEVENDDDPRHTVRQTLYRDLENLASSATSRLTWWDAGVDAEDGNDNGGAVWCHPGRQVRAQQVLYMEGLAPEDDLRLGDHPAVHEVATSASIYVDCGRCGELAVDGAALATVPCLDLSLPEHGHTWERWVMGMSTTGVRCLGCDLEIPDEWAGVGPLYRYVVLDQNGSAIQHTDSWAIAAGRAREYGPQASVWDHETRTFQIRGQ